MGERPSAIEPTITDHMYRRNSAAYTKVPLLPLPPAGRQPDMRVTGVCWCKEPLEAHVYRSGWNVLTKKKEMP